MCNFKNESRYHDQHDGSNIPYQLQMLSISALTVLTTIQWPHMSSVSSAIAWKMFIALN